MSGTTLAEVELPDDAPPNMAGLGTPDPRGLTGHFENRQRRAERERDVAAYEAMRLSRPLRPPVVVFAPERRNAAQAEARRDRKRGLL